MLGYSVGKVPLLCSLFLKAICLLLADKIEMKTDYIVGGEEA